MEGLASNGLVTQLSIITNKYLRRMNTSTENSESALRALDLSKQVSSPEGPLTILDNVSLDIHHGESVAIVGASGAGKSTLLGLLAGLDVPSEGKIWLAGTEITSLDEDGRAALRADSVGFVFQSFHLISSLTALENVMLPLELAGVDHAAEAALQAIRTVGLEPRKGHYPHQLSGGEKQRVAIARAFVVRPAVLFADEPTGNLDSENGNRVLSQLIDLKTEQGATLILVTHNPDIARAADRVMTLEDGRLTQDISRTPGQGR